MSDQAMAKPGFVLSLIACGLGVLGIVTPIVGSLFVLLTLVLGTISFIKSLKAKYWPAFGFSVLAAVLVVFGVMTSPILLGIIFGAAAPKKADAVSAEIPAAAGAVTPEKSPISDVSAPPMTAPSVAPNYKQICEDKMTAYAIQNRADPVQYVASNQAYLQQCAQSMAQQAGGTK